MTRQRLHIRTSKYGIRFYAGRHLGFKAKNKNSFLDARIGPFGPYLAAGVRHEGAFTGGSIGAKGKKIWAGYSRKGFSGSVNHNFSFGKTGVKVKIKKLRFSI